MSAAGGPEREHPRELAGKEARATRLPRRSGGRLLLAAIVWALALGSVAFRFDRGWIPADEGMLAQSAERLLAGEIPHRDFDESYTGGLTALHALGFAVFGVRLLALRWVLLVAFALFVPALLFVAGRVARPAAAAAAVLLAVAWSVPNYFASLPSWYVLFLAVVGVAALFLYLETRRRGWLFAAGACGGLSCLVIVVGVYSVAAGLLFLLYEESLEPERPEPPSGRRAGPPGTQALATLLGWKVFGAAAFLALLCLLLHRRLGAAEALHFLAPSVLLCAVLLRAEAGRGHGAFAVRVRRLASSIGVFLGGVAAPLLLLAGVYLAAGAFSDLVRGLVVLPQRRFGSAWTSPPGLDALLAAAPYGAVLAFPGLFARRHRAAGVVAGILLAGLLAVSDRTAVYRVIWLSARGLPIVVVLVGCWTLDRSLRGSRPPGVMESKLFLLLVAAALLALRQFPFAAPIYFCYGAPLVVLAVLALLSLEPSAPRAVHWCVLVFYLSFALLRTNGRALADLGFRCVPYPATTRIALERAGLRVPEPEAREYERLVDLVRRFSKGPFVYAAPDAPEVAFLSARRNPTRVLYDFLSGPPLPPGALLSVLDAGRVHVAVVNRRPDFSGPLPPATLSALEREFPFAAEAGRFVVRWRP